MKRVVVLLFVVLVACSNAKDDDTPSIAKVPSFTLTSADVKDGQPLPAAQLAASGNAVPPQLRWYGFAPATQSFAITVYDRDANFWHWALINIPNTTSGIEHGMPFLPPGAVELKNSTGRLGFAGAAPPKGSGVHHYEITVYALDVKTLDATSASGVPKAMAGHILGKAVIVPTAES